MGTTNLPRLDSPALLLALCPLGPNALKIAVRMVYARQTRMRHPRAQAVEHEVRHWHGMGGGSMARGFLERHGEVWWAGAVAGTGAWS